MRPSKFTAAIALGAALTGPAPVRAQAPVPAWARDTALLAAGSRVRLHTPRLGVQQERWSGSVARLDSGWMTVRGVDRQLWAVPWDRIDLLEVSRGRRSPLAGAARGALLGAAVGAATRAAWSALQRGRPAIDGQRERPSWVSVELTGAMALFGAAVGALTVRDQWEELPVDAARDHARRHAEQDGR